MILTLDSFMMNRHAKYQGQRSVGSSYVLLDADTRTAPTAVRKGREYHTPGIELATVPLESQANALTIRPPGHTILLYQDHQSRGNDEDDELSFNATILPASLRHPVRNSDIGHRCGNCCRAVERISELNH